MERAGYLPPGPKKKKSRSLPTYGRGEFIDHKAIFAAFERQDREAKKKRQSNKKKQTVSCLPLSTHRNSDRESSLSSDTSCSSLEFIRPDKLPTEEHRYNVHPPLQEERSSSKSPTQSKESSPSHRSKSWGSVAVSPDGGGVSSSPGGTCLKPGGSSSSTTSTKGSSTDSVSRKERLDALKARVEAEREKYRGSSSSEDEQQIRHQKRLPRYHSDEAIHRSSRDGPSRPSRPGDKMGGRTSQDETARESFKRAERMDRNIEIIEGKFKNGDLKKPPMGRQGKISVPQWSESRTPNCYFYDHMRGNFRQIASTDHPHVVNMDGIKDSGSPWFSELNTVGLPLSSSASTRWLDYPNGSFHQEFHNRGGHNKLDMLTVSTLSSNGVPISLLSQPSPPDSGVSSQSVASSPSLGRAPTPPPRAAQLSRGMYGPGLPYSSVYDGYKGYAHRPASCALDPSGRCGHNSQWTHSTTGTCNEQLPYKRCSVQSSTSSSMSSAREDPQSHFHRVLPPPPGSRMADPLYSYTDMSPPTRRHQPTSVVYSYTDQAPRPRDRHQPPYRPLTSTVNDAQADLKRSDLNFRRLLCNMQRDNKTDHRQNNSRVQHPLLSQNSSSRIMPVSSPPSYRNGGIHPSAVQRLRSSHCYDSRETLSSPTSVRDVYSPDYLSPSEALAYKEHPSKYSGPGAVQRSRTGIHQEITGNQRKDLANRRVDEMVQQEKEKRCSQKLENALEELETIYRSLKLNEDDDLLDRAERRDLPTVHQLAKFHPLPTRTNSSGHVSQPEESASDCSTHPLSRSHSDNIQSLLRQHGGEPQPSKGYRRRYRRAGVPNKVTDDLAFRKHQRPAAPSATVKPTSYLLCSSHFTPSLAVRGHLEDIITVDPKPDVERDDLLNRKYTQADAAKVGPPHPPFGIPLSPMSQSFSSDYLHAQPDNIPKPVFRPRETPDVVRDDMAFRNLRKDNNRNQDPSASDSSTTKYKAPSGGSRKKNRAARSLSANISQLMLECEARDKPLEFERAQSMTDLIAAMEEESCRWQQLDFDQRDYERQTANETLMNGAKNQVFTLECTDIYRDNLNEQLTSPDTTLSESQTGYSDQDFAVHHMKPKIHQSDIAPHDGAWRTVAPLLSPDLRRGNSYSPAPSSSSLTSQSPVIPKKNLLISSPPPSFWPDSDARKLKVTPIDEGQLEELLSSLARETQAASPVQEVTNGHSGSSRDAVPKGELHDVSVLA